MNNPSKHTSNSKKSKENLAKELGERWKLKNFLSDEFTFVLRKQTEKNIIREDFKFKDKLTNFLLKEKRALRLQNGHNCLFFDY